MLRALLVFALLPACTQGPPDCFDVQDLEARVGPGTEPEISWDMGPVAELAVEELGSGMNIWLVQATPERASDDPNLIESPLVYGAEPPMSETVRPARSLVEGADYALFATVECDSYGGPGAQRTAYAEFTP